MFCFVFLKQTTYSQVQPTLLPILANNGYHPHSHHGQQQQQQHQQQQQQVQNLHMQQLYAAASDPISLLHQVNATANVSPGAAAASANGLLPPQQRTDRLQVCVNSHTYTFCNDILFLLLLRRDVKVSVNFFLFGKLFPTTSAKTKKRCLI